MQTFEADILGNVDHFQNLIAWYVVCVNSVGGVCLALGFATRWAALFNVPVMIGAAVFVHGGSGLLGANNDLQFTLFILFSLILLAWRGSGKFSMDHYLKHEA